MSNPRLTLPESLDIIPASEVSQLIEATDSDFAEVESRARAAVDEADRAEAEARDAGLDTEDATWSMVRLQSFITSLREEAERDAAATIEVARHRARVRLQDAAVEAEQIRQGLAPVLVNGSTPPAGFAAPAVGDPARIPTEDIEVHEVPHASSVPTGAPVEPTSTRVSPTPVPASAITHAAPMTASWPQDAFPHPHAQSGTTVKVAAPVAAAAVAMSAPPSAPPAPPEPVAPSGPDPRADDHAWLFAHEAEAASAPGGVDDQSSFLDEELFAAPVEAAPAPRQPAPEQPPMAQPVPAAPTRPRRRGRIPVSAILEVLAVLLILVFILLRLS